VLLRAPPKAEVQVLLRPEAGYHGLKGRQFPAAHSATLPRHNQAWRFVLLTCAELRTALTDRGGG